MNCRASERDEHSCVGERSAEFWDIVIEFEHVCSRVRAYDRIFHIKFHS